MVFVPTPAIDGVKTLVTELTPGPEYIPPIGIAPFSTKGAAVMVVMLSKQKGNETRGAGNELIIILPDEAGLLVTQGRLDLITQRMLSPAWGAKEKVCELVPWFVPFTFH